MVISITFSIFFISIVSEFFVYAMTALLKKDIYIEQLKLSKKDGLHLFFHVKEKNEAQPTRRPRSK